MVGFNTIEAISGPDAIEKVTKQSFQLVLMDLRMPGMDGYETTRRLASLEQDRHVPVIAITATPLHEHENILESGFAGLIHKPFHKRDMFEMIGRLLEITYDYEEQPVTNLPGGRSVSEDMTEEIGQLSDKLISRMQQALSVADLDQLYELIREIETTMPELASNLMSHIINYDYNYLQKVLTKKESGS